jgi:hypothetical protein
MSGEGSGNDQWGHNAEDSVKLGSNEYNRSLIVSKRIDMQRKKTCIKNVNSRGFGALKMAMCGDVQ